MTRAENPLAAFNSPVWSSEEIFHDSAAYFQAMVRDIDAAQTNVDVEAYIFAADSIGDTITQALMAAVSRGVQVRLLVDGLGSRDWFERTYQRLLAAGVRLRIFNPLPWPLSGLVPRGWRHLERTWRLMTSINRRDHRKLILIDQKIAYTGSINIFAAALVWRETGIRLTGGELAALQASFEVVWRRGQHPLNLPSVRRRRRLLKNLSALRLVRLNMTARQRRRSLDELLWRMKAAHRRIWITNPYFVPPLRLLEALRVVAQSGVQVRLLLPEESDVAIVRFVSRYYYEPLLRAGVEIYEYRPRILHAKTVLIDDWCTVGSTNLNHRSWVHDLELDVVPTSAESRQSLEQRFLDDLEESSRIDPNHLRRRSWWTKLLAPFILIARGWM